MILMMLAAISRSLKEAFPGSAVYADKVPQGLNPPAFYIEALQAGRTQELGKRWRQTQMFDIHYFPEQEDRRTLYAVGEELFSALGLISLPDGGSLRGGSMQYEVVDGVLHFIVQYTVFLRETVPKEPMEELYLEENVKE